MREMKMRRAAAGAESGREFERGGRQAAAAAVRGLLLKLAVCAAAAAAASAQTAPAYRIEEIAFNNLKEDLKGEMTVPDFSENLESSGVGCGWSLIHSGQRPPGDGGPASQAILCMPQAMRTDGAGNIFILENHYRIRRIDAATGVIDTVFGRGVYYDDEQYYEFGGRGLFRSIRRGGGRRSPKPHIVWDDEGYFVRIKDGAPAVEVSVPEITSIDVDAAGNLFVVVDVRGLSRRYQIYKVDAAAGTISHVAGSGRKGFGGDGGPAVEAGFDVIRGMAADSAGNLFVGDGGAVRRIDAASGFIITILDADKDLGRFSGGVDVSGMDASGNLLMNGIINHFRGQGSVLLRLEIATGAITHVAGNGRPTWTGSSSYEEFVADGAPGDGGPAVQAPLSAGLAPLNVYNRPVEDVAGNIFVIDEIPPYRREQLLRRDVVLRRIDAVTGIIETVAGGGLYDTSLYESWWDKSPALLSALYMSSLAIDGDGNPIILGWDDRLYRLTPWSGGPAPTIAGGGVAQATGTPAVERVSPNALISVFGQDFTAPGEPALAAGIDASGGVPVNLADTCLYIYRRRREPEWRGRRPNNEYPFMSRKRLPLFLVSPTQINAQAPHDLAVDEGGVKVTVIRGCGTADELRSVEVSVEVGALSPAFFNVVNNPDGRNPLVAQHGGGPALVGPPELGAAFTPAAPGEVVTLYGTGFGPTDPPLEAGVVPGVAAAMVYPISFRVGGKAVPPQDVLYAGAAPCCAGLYQFSLRLPADLPDGDAPVTADVLGILTPQGPFLPVRRR